MISIRQTSSTPYLNALVSTGELKEVETYDVDFDHQFLETEKYDSKPTYKKFLGYRPGVYVIGDKIVYIENSDGNTNVRFYQAETHKRFFALLESQLHPCESLQSRLWFVLEGNCQ